jgi:hypothetical protein
MIRKAAPHGPPGNVASNLTTLTNVPGFGQMIRSKPKCLEPKSRNPEFSKDLESKRASNPCHPWRDNGAGDAECAGAGLVVGFHRSTTVQDVVNLEIRFNMESLLKAEYPGDP